MRAGMILCLTTAALYFRPATALADCDEPSAPSCVESYDHFEDESDFSQCKNEMSSYESDVNEYTECLENEVKHAQDEAEQKAEEAKSAYSDAVDGFNRRARAE